MLPPGLSTRSTTAFHRIVVARLAQQIRGALAADRARRLMAVENLPRGHHDADLGVRFGFQTLLGAHRGQVLIHPDGIEGMGVLDPPPPSPSVRRPLGGGSSAP